MSQAAVRGRVSKGLVMAQRLKPWVDLTERDIFSSPPQDVSWIYD